MTVERLQKILSNAGVASRREAEEMVLAGRVAVNGKVAAMLGSRADPEVDEITVDGVPVDLGRYRYFALHKPRGFVTTASDEQGRETVLDLVPIGDVQLHPVGRLDMDSEGLLLITNDGHLTDLLTHPRYEIEKEYLVGLDAPLSQSDVQRLVRGVESEGERLRATSAQPAMAPAAAPGEPEPEAPAWVLLTLREGKNREIRRMMDALGRRVSVLRRVRVGPLRLGTLGSGSFRELEQAEVQALYSAAKQAHGGARAKETPRAPLQGAPRRSRAATAAPAARPRSAAPMPPPTRGKPATPRGAKPAPRPGESDDDRGRRVAPPRGATPARPGAPKGPAGGLQNTPQGAAKGRATGRSGERETGSRRGKRPGGPGGGATRPGVRGGRQGPQPGAGGRGPGARAGEGRPGPERPGGPRGGSPKAQGRPSRGSGPGGSRRGTSGSRR